MSTERQNLVRTWRGIEIPAPGRWVVDSSRSRVEFVIRYLLAARARVRFRRFAGSIDVADRPEDTKLTADVGADSVDTGIRALDRLLRSPRFLDPARFPIIRFRASRLEPTRGSRFVLHGELTVRDVTRPITLDVDYGGILPDPSRAVFRASSEVDRNEFRLTANRLLEIGGWLVRRRMRIDLRIEALPDSLLLHT